MVDQEDVDMTTPQGDSEFTSTTNNGKHSSSNTTSTSTSQQQRRVTSRNPQWTYFKLQLIPQSQRPIKNFALDTLSARTYLSAALSQFLGLMGTSISIDILKIENPSISASTVSRSQTTTKVSSTEVSVPPTVWIRVPRDDGSAVLAALSSWVGAISSHSSYSTGVLASAVAAASAAASTVVDDGRAESGNEDGRVGVAWRICAKGNYLSAIVHGSGVDLFVP